MTIAYLLLIALSPLVGWLLGAWQAKRYRRRRVQLQLRDCTFANHNENGMVIRNIGGLIVLYTHPDWIYTGTRLTRCVEIIGDDPGEIEQWEPGE